MIFTENGKSVQKAPAKEIIRNTVLSFVIAYGLHYLAYFLRVRYFALIDSLQPGEGPAHVLMYTGHVLFLAVLLLYALAVAEDRKYILGFLPRKGRKDPLWLLAGAVTGFVLMGACILAANLHGDITVGAGSGVGRGIFIPAFLAVFLQASTEEIESRAFLFGRMKGAGVPLAAAIPVSAFFFSYLHAANPGFGWIPLLSIFVVGLQYALSYHYFGSLWFSCAAHTLWNFTQDFIFGLPDSGKPAAVSVMNTAVNGSSFFYDKDFGIEGSWMAICINALACVIIFLIGRKLAKRRIQA